MVHKCNEVFSNLIHIIISASNLFFFSILQVLEGMKNENTPNKRILLKGTRAAVVDTVINDWHFFNCKVTGENLKYECWECGLPQWTTEGKQGCVDPQPTSASKDGW